MVLILVSSAFTLIREAQQPVLRLPRLRRQINPKIWPNVMSQTNQDS